MKEEIKSNNDNNLKETFVQRFEAQILSGHFCIGAKLPSERELSSLLGVSRAIVREGLTELASMGLVSMKPRVRTIVNDFRTDGSLALLNALFRYREGSLGQQFFESAVQMRKLMDVDFARLVALNRTEEHIASFEAILEKEKIIDHSRIDELVELDYNFHHCIAIATGNFIYPLYANSFKPFYANLVEQFYSDPAVVPVVFTFHRMLVQAIKKRDEKDAQEIMRQMLDHGEEQMKNQIGTKRKEENE